MVFVHNFNVEPFEFEGGGGGWMINYDSHNKGQNYITKAIFKLLIVILEVMHLYYWIIYPYIPVYFISLVNALSDLNKLPRFITMYILV